MNATWREELDRNGYCIARQVFNSAEVEALLAAWNAMVEKAAADAGLIRNAGGSITAARNVLSIFPAARDCWRRESLVDKVIETLGHEAGLVRGLWFDKPPEQSWSLAWHKDLTIAVERNDLLSNVFTHPTTKAGVAHVEAPVSLLERMLTLRIHLDPVTMENGPLQVVAGSHRQGKDAAGESGQIETILATAGDVLLMRPLLSHASIASAAGTTLHRRILHLEFAATRDLPDGFQWQTFLPLPRESEAAI